mmetsp:Transcript_25625/g.46340  ORF Transcript_25625/g.46340 Transcript_25625/m.46340 type:complete len:120 (+) Transcript_25625:142-501(+)
MLPGAPSPSWREALADGCDMCIMRIHSKQSHHRKSSKFTEKATLLGTVESLRPIAAVFSATRQTSLLRAVTRMIDESLQRLPEGNYNKLSTKKYIPGTRIPSKMFFRIGNASEPSCGGT